MVSRADRFGLQRRSEAVGGEWRCREAVKKWDWLRAETAKTLEDRRSRRCLSQFFHSLGVSAIRIAATAADSEQRPAAAAERAVRNPAAAAERWSRWLAAPAELPLRHLAAAAVPRGFDLGPAAVRTFRTAGTRRRRPSHRRAGRAEVRRQGMGWSWPSDGKGDDDDDDDAKEEKSSTGQKHQRQVR
jgi:hypothetical protein